MQLVNIDYIPGKEIEALGLVKGTVVYSNSYMWSNEDTTARDSYKVTVDRMWNAPEHTAKQMVVTIHRTAQEAPLEVGQRIFLVGMMLSNSGGIMDGETSVDTAAYVQFATGLSYEQLTAIQQNPYIIIPDGVDSEAYIQDFLESTGLDEILQRQLRSLYTVSLRQTQDMNMIPIFIQGKALTYEGRVLTPADMGKKVCVIPSGLSQRNRLSVGDTIALAAADGCYAIGFEPFIGRETGEPYTDDASLEFGEHEEYEIVGIYSQKGVRPDNNLYFSDTDIFIPAQADTAAETVRPYSFSFRVPGPDYPAFLEEFQPVLDAQG